MSVKQKSRIAPVVLIGLGLLCVGCGAVKMYPGPELPRDQVAVLEIQNVTVYTFDGMPPGGKKKLQMLPGEHEMRFSHSQSGYSEQLHTYTFTAEAGHAYLFDADYEFQRTMSWHPWIKDSANGKIVGSWK
jgi:hypothetical protein